jgi:hypothetical protein
MLVKLNMSLKISVRVCSYRQLCPLTSIDTVVESLSIAHNLHKVLYERGLEPARYCGAERRISSYYLCR